MHWIEIHITCSADQAEQVSEQLMSFGALAVTFRDAADQPIYEPLPSQSPDLWQETLATGLFDEQQSLQEVLASLEQQQAIGLIKNFHIQPLADQDWVRVNLDSFKPIMIGQRLCICPSWIKPPHSEKINIILDPGLAFGTGTHPTTALCLEWLENNVTPSSLVIDYGCGSGILGIAALKLGAEKVIAIDYDPQALTATQANSELNRVPKTRLCTYFPENAPETPADLIIANILAQPLIMLAPVFYKLLKNNGKIAISGVLEEQLSQVIAAYQPWFNLVGHHLNHGWACLEARKSK
jgi:ribosomal protein L11 methyltransferase